MTRAPGRALVLAGDLRTVLATLDRVMAVRGARVTLGDLRAGEAA